jgi:AraC family transcriptional regulator
MLMEATRSIVHAEQKWFALLNDTDDDGPKRRVSATRWSGVADEPYEVVAAINGDCPVLGITLRPMDLTLFADHTLLHEGRMQQGCIRVNDAGQNLRGIYRGAYDTLHLFIPSTVIEDCLESGYGHTNRPTAALAPVRPTRDPVIERLAHALIRADDFGPGFAQCYADSVSLAIVARLLGGNAERTDSTGSPRVAALSRWRLKRATDYMAAHLDEPIGLPEIAAATGLTRMHFAAQFKVATGLRPHEYLLRMRIDRAQDLLATTRQPLVEIALDVGFRSQSHFTTVFTRIAGTTPNAWRNENGHHPHCTSPAPLRQSA